MIAENLSIPTHTQIYNCAMNLFTLFKYFFSENSLLPSVLKQYSDMKLFMDVSLYENNLM